MLVVDGLMHIRFTNLSTGKIEDLAAADYNGALSLFRYSMRVATSNTRIELLSGDVVLRSHTVEYVETIPSVLHQGS
jgi:hypothetical protein